MKQPPYSPQITSLRKFVVNYRHIDFREHVLHLSRWIRKIVSWSRLEHLELVMENCEYFRGPYLNYGGLVEHISHRHGGTIRVLRLMHSYIDSTTVSMLCQKCPNLEETSFGVNMSTLVGQCKTNVFSHTSDLAVSLSVARIPPKGCAVVKITTGFLPGMQH